MRNARILGCLVVAAALALPAGAFEVAEISLKELGDGSIVEFESSFCEVVVGDTISVMLGGDEGDAAIVEVVAAYVKAHNGATPNRGKKKGGPRTASITPIIGADGRSVDITLDAADEGWRTVHTRLELSSGDKLGVNLHSNPCEDAEDDDQEEMQ